MAKVGQSGMSLSDLNYSETEVRGSLESRSSRTGWATNQDPISKEKKKRSDGHWDNSLPDRSHMVISLKIIGLP